MSSAPSPRLAIRLLGPVHVEVDGAPIVVDTRKAIALLAYLAMTGHAASRETLAALLWPESDETASRNALRRTLSVLHAAVGGAGMSIERTTVSVRPDETWVDAWQFRAALDRARGHGHAPDEPCGQCISALDDAVSLDRGEFMAGFSLRDSEAFDEWQRAEVEAHRRELAGAFERLARARAASAAWDAALGAARRWLALDTLHEPAHRMLMTILARSGETAAAIRQYRECVRILDAELGVAPLEDTVALYEDIRSGRIGRSSRIGRSGAARAAPSASGRSIEGRTPRDRIDVPLVGRDTDLRMLLGGYAAIGPAGRLLVIEGEPGIGKTRLVGAFCEAVGQRGAIALRSRAFAGEASVPYAPVVALIRAGIKRADASTLLASVRPDLRAAVSRLIPDPALSIEAPERRDMAPQAADPFGPARLLEGVADVLTAILSGPVPGVMVVDDVDWADGSTIEVLAYLIRRLGERPLAVLLTSRPLDAGDVRAHALAVAERDGLLTRIELGRLGRSDVHRLVEAVRGPAESARVGDALHAESEGLPLYVVEALAAPDLAAGRIPSGMLGILRARLTGLGDVANQVLAAAAVIGRAFDFETVRAASGRSEEEVIAGLEELRARGIVRELAGEASADVGFDFTHGSLRDVAYEALALVRRRLLHRRVADAIRARPPGDERMRWSLIARHEDRAGRAGEAAEAHQRAGSEALRVFANQEAREHLEAALALGHPAPGELHVALGDVLTLLGDYRAAIAHLEAAASLVEPDREFSVEHRLALVHARRGLWSSADSHVAAALETAPSDPVVRSRLLADQSTIAGHLGDFERATSLAMEALRIAEAGSDVDGIARACEVLGVLARHRGDPDAARGFLERAVVTSRGARDAGLRVAALNASALLLADQGDNDRAITITIEALSECERQGDRHREAALENNLADLLRATGRREEAMVHLKRAVAIFADVGDPEVLEPEIWKLVDW